MGQVGKLAFVFAGQGAQFPGMGKQLYESSSAAKKVFDMAESLRPGTLRLCFEGTAEELSLTVNTQPALFAMDLACARALESAGIRADFAAGFSLGEIAALAFAGAMSDEDAFRLVCRRGEFMHECAVKNPGAMTAAVRLSDETVEKLASEFARVYPVNYNCEGQVAVASSAAEIDAFEARVKESGGRAIRLAVSGAFHSPFMAEASEKMSEYVKTVPVHAPIVPLFSNATGEPYPSEPEKIRELIASQIMSPVRWRQTVVGLSQLGADSFVECGAGKTLSGLVKKSAPEAAVSRVEDSATLAETVEALSLRKS